MPIQGPGAWPVTTCRHPANTIDIMARYQILPFSAALNCSICLAGRWDVAFWF